MASPTVDPTSPDRTASPSRRSDSGPAAVTDRLEEHRAALTRYCQWKLGSPDAEDAVQETFLRALHAVHQFEGRGPLQAWLYRIATNVCIDVLERRRRGARPMDFGPANESISGTPGALAEITWIDRPYGRTDPSGDPAEVSESREVVARALAAALRYLPPRQRGVVILREVLQWRAREVAELLGTSVASVNSALQRARATLESRALSADAPIWIEEQEREVFRRYVRAFERNDIAALAQLICDEARGPRAVRAVVDEQERRSDFRSLEEAA
jgi:RNA polymerase sigma-70 factor (ECF subfamily)